MSKLTWLELLKVGDTVILVDPSGPVEVSTVVERVTLNKIYVNGLPFNKNNEGTFQRFFLKNAELTEEVKNKIDAMSYYEILSIWRFASSDNPLVQGEVGKYFALALSKKRKEIGPDGHVLTSKQVGWRG